MTIMATHFAIVLGTWRLRVRIDLDEPREDVVESGSLADDRARADSGSRDRQRSAVSSAQRWN